MLRFLLFFATLTVLSFSSCDDDAFWDDTAVIIGSDNVVTTDRSVSDFDRVEVAGSIDVDVRPGQAFEVLVTANDNLFDRIATERNGRTLRIFFEEGSYRNTTKLVTVSLPLLAELDVKGSSDVAVSGLTDQDSLLVSLEGSADVTFTGSRVEHLVVESNGSADLEAFGLQTTTTAIDVAGSSDLDLSVSESLTGSVIGSAEVRYRGNPSVEVSVSGSGSVERE